MERREFAIGMMMLAGVPAFGQGKGRMPDLSKYPKSEVKGTITKVRLAMGQGMPPLLTVKTAVGEESIVLGSMRYLMENDFNPKAGELVEARVFRAEDGLYAIEVTLLTQNTLPKQKRTLRLRDEEGRPLWRGGFWRPD
ncbi:MAG: hypothetical protein JNK87_10495 [Bryobacterales bacterium]|nr:hypothetical protein [Bryobacterales bacterium]